MLFGELHTNVGFAHAVNYNGMKLKLISRQEIIRKRQALTRMGIRPAFMSDMSLRMRERINLRPTMRTVSTTFRSPIVSNVYNSVFCEKLTNPEWRK